MKKVLLGMSGGVDSAVAAYLLKEKGYDVIGVTFRLYTDNESDIEDAKRVAALVGIEHMVVDFRQCFMENVIDKFIECYKFGGTPNPCVECNKHIKFGKMFDLADELSADYVATGHYARVEGNSDGEFLLRKSVDLSKDQTYVLYSLTREKLKRIIFPLGDLSKIEARRIAEENGFINARKKDSQDICFVPDGEYAEFIRRETGESFPDGDFVNFQGEILGRHKGIIRYTVGQRKGLGIALGKPVFVCAKNTETNTVVLGDDEDLYERHLTAHDVNLIMYEQLSSPTRVMAKIRYNQSEQSATAISIGEGKIKVEFDAPQRAIAKGQSVVLYDKDVVIGGGIID